MKRTLLAIFVLAAALALPASASARIVELGETAEEASPSCPSDPCEAVVRVTGLQGSMAGGRKNPYYIRRNGYIVAFTVRLSEPTADQIDYFTDNFGSPSQVRLSVLRRGDTRRTRLNYRLVAQSELFELDPYFGSSPTFVLQEPLRVRKTHWISVSVPTWAPMFAVGLGRDDWWRASRSRGDCDALRQFAVEDLREVNMFGCTYSGARLLYTATYVPDPKPTADSEN
jgi:hypothetical protein